MNQVKDDMSKRDFAEAYASMTPLEVSLLFNVNAKTIQRWIERGFLPENSFFRTPGGHRRYFVYAIDLQLAKQIADPAIRKAMIEDAKHRAMLRTQATVKRRPPSQRQP